MTTIKLTHELKKPFNNGFPSVMVQFDPSDRHFDHERLNWLPLHSEILEILKLMAEFEDLRYPMDKGFRGRLMLFDEIKKVFV